MTPTPVIKDPTHPDFPHGTERGYWRGCTCDPCDTARRRGNKARDLRRARGIPPRIDSTRVRNHITWLVSHAGVSNSSVSLAAGLAETTAQQILTRRSAVTRATAAAILAVTPEQAAATAAVVDAARPVRLVRALQAQGWSLTWQARSLGYGPGVRAPDFLYSGPGHVMYRTVADRVEALAAEIGDSEPSPSEIPLWVQRRCKRQAKEAGYYPLRCYHPDGTLNYAAIPDHPWTEATTRCDHLLADLYAILTGGDVSIKKVAQARRPRADYPGDEAWSTAWQSWERTITRAIRAMGLTGHDRTPGYGTPRVRAVRDALRECVTPPSTADPVTVALAVGAVPTGGMGSVPKDHPGREGVDELRGWITAREEQYGRKTTRRAGGTAVQDAA